MLPMKTTSRVVMRVMSLGACFCSVLVAMADIELPYCTEMCESSHGEIQRGGDCGSPVEDPNTGVVTCSGACTATWTFVAGDGCVDMVEPTGSFCLGVNPGTTAEPTLQTSCVYTETCRCNVLEVQGGNPTQHAGPTCTSAACPEYKEPKEELEMP